MSTNLKLQTAVHLALGVGAGAMALSYVPNAVAQDADVQEFDDATIEEVVVTGSRIARADIDSASPVTVMSRDDIEATGLTDIGSLLQSMPSMSGSPVGTTTNNGNTATGSVRIDLRGMGPARTLTLLNGHRMVDSDFQAIPSMMIDRIEILKDGASAVYGADAVSGVVNIITRRDFQGVELTAQVADWQDTKAGMMYSFGAIAGSEFERGNVVIGLEYVDQEEAYQSDVPWDYFQHSPYIYPEGCENQPMAPYTGSPDGGCFLIGSSRIPQSRLGFVSQGTFLIGQANTTPYGVGLMEPHDGRQYNYAPVNYMQTPFERTNIFGEAHFDITDSVRFNAEFRANFRESGQQLAPQPYNSPTDPGYNGVWEGLPYSGIHQDNYYLRNAVDAYNAATGSSLVYEPVRDARRRMIEIPRTYDQDVTQYQYVVGFEGTFADMDWDVFLNQGHRSIVSINRGQFDGIRLGNAMGPSADMDGDGMPECYTDVSDPASLIAGCVPFNFFGGGEVDPVTSQPTVTTVTQDMLDYVSATLTNHRQWDATSFGANITGNVFNLPGGPLGWAAGYGYWKQEYRYSPDSGVAAGTVTGNTGPGTEGSLTNNSVYLEVLAPVWDNGTQELILKGGLRYDDWDQFDGDSTWQFGAEFQAIESLKLRGTYGTVFRAPTISDLFAGQVDSFPTYSDPCVARGGEPIAPGCAQEGVQLDTQVLAKVGGNPNLFPETGDTYTVGMVWTPEFGDHGFSATVDYWSIDLEDAISSLGVQFTLDSCYQDLDPNACALITRRPADYSVGQIIDGSINVADQGAKGVDTELRWDYASNVGAWQASILWVHMLERTKTAFAGAEERDLAGRYSDSTAEDGGAYAQDKANFKLQWMLGDLSIGYLGEYISGMDADTFCNCDSDGDPSNNGPDGTYIQDVSSIWYHDLVAAYTWRSFTVSGGLTNLSDEEPPMIETGFNATTDPATYRMFGRGYYLRLSWKY